MKKLYIITACIIATSITGYSKPLNGVSEKTQKINTNRLNDTEVDKRIDEIRKWYAQIQKIGLKNGVTKQRDKFDSFGIGYPKSAFPQIVKTYKLSEEYDLIQCDFSGYEWAQTISIYKKFGKIFFVFYDDACESSRYEHRYYCDSNENVIRVLEREFSYGEEITKNSSYVSLDPTMSTIQEYLSDIFTDINYVLRKN